MEPFIGQIMMFGGNFAPRGWAMCEGQLLAISSHTALFSILGTSYGGDGRSTFGLPDMRGRVSMGHGRGPGLTPRDFYGEKGGHEYTQLTVSNLPSHNHVATLHAEGTAASTGNPSNNMLGIVLGDTKIYSPSDPAAQVDMHAHSISVSNQGGNQSFSNQQPFLVTNYIIALQGVYPSRD